MLLLLKLRDNCCYWIVLCLINAICRNYLILLLSKPDRELLPRSHPPHVLLDRCCFAYTELRLPVRRLKGEHLTERKYSLCRFVILLVPLIWLGWRRQRAERGGRGGVEVTRRISLEYLFNVLIENDKHSGAFSPAGEIKESELRETQHYGLEPNRSPLALAN